MNRRRYLALAGAGLAGLAGCGGSGSGGDGTENRATATATETVTLSGAGTSAGTGTPTGTPQSSIGGHPATVGYRAEPYRGSLSGHTVLAFEDPSCLRCRAFHQDTVPKLQENLLGPGKAAYVLRTYPVVFPWGESATQALEATFARDAGAFWALLDHYFTTQPEFDTDNVLDRTAAFLDSETDLDGDAVATDARNGAYDDAVQADIQAAKNADLGETTPIVLLFRDGEFVTSVNGSVSYTIIAQALGVA